MIEDAPSPPDIMQCPGMLRWLPLEYHLYFAEAYTTKRLVHHQTQWFWLIGKAERQQDSRSSAFFLICASQRHLVGHGFFRGLLLLDVL